MTFRAGAAVSTVALLAALLVGCTAPPSPVERQRADTPEGFGGSSVVVTPDWVDGRPGDVVRWLRAPDLENGYGGCV